MPSIHIVTHAYAGDLPQYAVFLRAQLSSLVLNKGPEGVSVRVTVCNDKDDRLVEQVLDDLDDAFAEAKIGLINIWMSKGRLFRRCIGRNEAILESRGRTDEIFWFTDCDHVFGPNCLTSLWVSWLNIPPSTVMVWPSHLKIHATHELGDRYWQSHFNSRGVIDIDPTEFQLKTYHKAIGGVQIVDGYFARTHGYLPDPKWQTPTDGTKPFPDFRDDVKFRKFCLQNGEVRPIVIDNLYRLRHTKATYK